MASADENTWWAENTTTFMCISQDHHIQLELNPTNSSASYAPLQIKKLQEDMDYYLDCYKVFYFSRDEPCISCKANLKKLL